MFTSIIFYLVVSISYVDEQGDDLPGGTKAGSSGNGITPEEQCALSKELQDIVKVVYHEGESPDECSSSVSSSSLPGDSSSTATMSVSSTTTASPPSYSGGDYLSTITQILGVVVNANPNITKATPGQIYTVAYMGGSNFTVANVMQRMDGQ
jgi:hypothetical protein